MLIKHADNPNATMAHRDTPPPPPLHVFACIRGEKEEDSFILMSGGTTKPKSVCPSPANMSML